MHADDYEMFVETFRRLVTAFRLKLAEDAFATLARVYFQVLESATLEQVLQGARSCLRQHKRFPTAADWYAEIESPTPTVAGVDRRWLSQAEMDELARAAALRYEDHPCGCPACRQAGVDHRPLRFVPTIIDAAEEARAWNPSRNRVEVCGHWAHGAELARYYAARDQFFALAHRKAPRVLQLVGVVEREPGEEG